MGILGELELKELRWLRAYLMNNQTKLMKYNESKEAINFGYALQIIDKFIRELIGVDNG